MVKAKDRELEKMSMDDSERLRQQQQQLAAMEPQAALPNQHAV